MKRRDEPRFEARPDLPHYWAFDVPGQGEHVFRIPFQLTVVRLLKRAAEAVDKLADDEKAEQSIVHACAMIGHCWRHRDYDLESRPGDDLQAFGASVLEELHEAGYSPRAIYALAPALMARLRDSVIEDREVENRADFSEAVPATGS